MADIDLLKEILRKMENVAVAFSGGVDSAFLLCVAADTPGVNVIALTSASPGVPESEIKEASDICRQRNIKHIIFEGKELEIKQYRENHPERCYFCKKALFEKMLKLATENSKSILVDGSNTDDAHVYRPGIKALSELGIRSPLREAGFSKADVRKASLEMGLPTWDKPSFSCLATRFPYGEEITEEKLKMVAEAESFLRKEGFKQFRVRMHENIARIELLPEDLERAIKPDIRKKIISEFKKTGFVYVTLDMEGYRSGSMDEVLGENFMGKILYLDCSAGISGDMTVGALLALGANKNKLLDVLTSLPVTGFKINISVIEKSGVFCTDFDVALDKIHENHDHDMEYLHGHDKTDKLAINEDGTVKEGTAKGHHHRTLSDIIKIIEASTATDNAKELAVKIFTILAEAESTAHGIPVERVHFHEVGAVDSIADILAAAVCLDDLEIESCIVNELTDGCGTIRTQHGILPVPVPAVRIIAEKYKLPLKSTDVKGEMVTPTGAAIVAALRTHKELPEKFTTVNAGCGAGKRDYKTRGYLRAVII